ncbi:MAG: hypothetical protein LBU36_07305 [Clostridiales bacterium]|jgi:predicted transcriptional regulator|nr:hypothetical protein [Clostridiales bacterium]
MKISKIKEILTADTLAGEERIDTEVICACGSDLMSDVLAGEAKEEFVLLTGLVNPQVIRTAEMVDMRAIVFVRGKTPTPEVLELAEEKGIVVLSTKCPLYIASGLLYTNGLRGAGSVETAL